MPYHHGGHVEAVAINFSSNNMAPLSPIARRYGTTASSTTSSALSSTTPKMSYRSSSSNSSLRNDYGKNFNLSRYSSSYSPTSSSGTNFDLSLYSPAYYKPNIQQPQRSLSSSLQQHYQQRPPALDLRGGDEQSSERFQRRPRRDSSSSPSPSARSSSQSSSGTSASGSTLQKRRSLLLEVNSNGLNSSTTTTTTTNSVQVFARDSNAENNTLVTDNNNHQTDSADQQQQHHHQKSSCGSRDPHLDSTNPTNNSANTDLLANNNATRYREPLLNNSSVEDENHHQQQQQPSSSRHIQPNDQTECSASGRAGRNRLQVQKNGRCGLNGLRNIGNTCFMNSVIQCLSNTKPLLEYLLNEQYLNDINSTTSSLKGLLIKAFSQVIQELWEENDDHVVNTAAFKSQIQRFAPRFMGYSQQDAQEFLRYLLEGLHEDVNRVKIKPTPIVTEIPENLSDSVKAAESWKRYVRSEDSTIVDVFVGQLRSSLKCTNCDHVSVTLDPFWDLSLPIPSRTGTERLSNCLHHFTKEETLDGDEKPTCSKCQTRRKCTKSFSIQKFPKILVIHLKRFSPTERFRGKMNVLVDFPLTDLNLSDFAAPKVQGCTYNLYGVANHSGTMHSGHYTAYCKHPYTGEWHEYNDSHVSPVSSRSVVSSEAYVLFYEQQPQSSHL